MHAKEADGRTTRAVQHYDDVISTVKAFFEERVRWATDQGIKEEQIILDPGLGFFISAEARYSFEIVRRLPELKALGFPLLLGPSRKSFLAGVSPGRTLSTEERLIPGVALSAIAAWLGVDILRTHDVQEGRLLLDTVKKAPAQSSQLFAVFNLITYSVSPATVAHDGVTAPAGHRCRLGSSASPNSGVGKSGLRWE